MASPVSILLEMGSKRHSFKNITDSEPVVSNSNLIERKPVNLKTKQKPVVLKTPCTWTHLYFANAERAISFTFIWRPGQKQIVGMLARVGQRLHPSAVHVIGGAFWGVQTWHLTRLETSTLPQAKVKITKILWAKNNYQLGKLVSRKEIICDDICQHL